MFVDRQLITSSRSRLLSVLEGLSDNQVNWKPDEMTWSIAQIIQHIATVEAGSSQLIPLGLAQEPNYVPNDIPLETLILDRSQKVNAPERLHPSDEPKTLAQLHAILQNSQQLFLAALDKVVDDSLLDQTAPPMPHPVFGKMSTGQWITALPLHEQRHIQQIEELKQRLPQL